MKSVFLKTRRIAAALVYACGALTAVVLAGIFLSHVQYVPFPDTMLPTPLYELATEWLALGTLPMLIATVCMGSVYETKGWKTVFLYLPFALCLAALLFWVGVWTVGIFRRDVLLDFSEQSGVHLTGGEVISSEDTHGGFHGDGYSVAVIRYADGAVREEMEENEDWHELPLSENLQTFVYQPYMEGLSIPEIAEGYYYFFDRHAKSVNPQDDAELLNRYSFNFTLALYDTNSNTLYLCKIDT